jgi:hypothetical protein
MNRWNLIRENVITALGNLPFERDVVIERIAQPVGVWAIIGPVAIGVCRTGGRATDAPEIGYHVNQPAEMMFQLVVRGDSARDNTEALDIAEEVASIALKVRDADVGVYGLGDEFDTGGVFLDYQNDGVMVFPAREPGGAGPIALVLTLKTTTLPL